MEHSFKLGIVRNAKSRVLRMYIGRIASPFQNAVKADQEYDEMMARYFADMEKQSRERLAEASDLIAKFVALAASKGVILGAEAFEYIQTETGVRVHF